jgi:N utilization substance protein A
VVGTVEMSDDDTVAMFMGILGVSRDFAEALARSQITTIEEVAYVPLDELLRITPLDEELAMQLRDKARQHVLFQAISFDTEDDLE